ncbi:MAG: glycosyltransferase family 4 protein [Bryobacterales bacterium]|nr:glycosyltransferase family 4 protein [Bryobacterales bacterium]
MNVLFVDQFGELGGAQRCLLDLIPAVRERGWRASAAVPSEGELAQCLGSLGVEVSLLPPARYESGRKPPGDALRFARALPVLARQISGLCSRYSANLLYVNGPRLLPAAALAHSRIPVLFHAHSYLPHGLSRTLARWALRRCNATVIGVSRFVSSYVAGAVAADRLFVIPNGAARLQCPRRAADGVCAGVIGRIAPEKGQLEFVHAARIVREQIPECRFLICGAPLIAPGDYAARVQLAARGLPMDFRSWQQDIGPVLSELDLLVVPSTGAEGFGRVIIEGFSAGVPVLAFRSGGIPEIIEDGKTGYLAERKTPESLAQYMIAILRDEESRKAVARNAFSQWQEHYTLARYRERITAVMALAAGIETPGQPAEPLRLR